MNNSYKIMKKNIQINIWVNLEHIQPNNIQPNLHEINFTMNF